MGQELKNNTSEEIDLIQLFGFFEKKIKTAINLIFDAIKSIYEIFIVFIKVLQQHVIKIGALVILATIIGYVYDGSKPKIYSSKMIVKPFFDSKYQLVTNIHYYNELVGNQQFSKLASLFELSEEEAKSLTGFEIKDGPESEKEKTRLYNSFMKSLDSAAAKTVNYEKFVDNITIYDSEIYQIEVRSTMNNVFGNLSKGFKKTFKSIDYSEANKLKKENLYRLNKTSIEKSLTDIDSLKKVYIKEFSKVNNQKVELIGSSAIKIGEEKIKTKEFELLQLQISEQKKLTTLESEALNQSQLFEVVSDFQLIGSINGGYVNKMKFMFPMLAFILSLVLIFGIKFNNYIKNYKLN